MADDLNRKGLDDQIEGVGKEVEGRVRNAVGGVTGDSSEELKGKAKELEGKTERKIGEIESDLEQDL